MADGSISSRTSWVSSRGGAAKRPTRRSTGGDEAAEAAAAAAAAAAQDDEYSPDDVLHLEDLDDALLLKVLWTRYQQRKIYTWCGNVLISVNPYRDIGVFNPEVATSYASDQIPHAPHLYATVRHALAAPGDKHAILITGESGAGKTEATRAILSFLAMKHSTANHVRDRLLLSTPVLEAFGNAKTRQNANSSRFGKFIEVHLSSELEVVGATLQPYMLEASRVAGVLPEGEDTYHVFYLLRSAIMTLSSSGLPSGNFWARMSRSRDWMELQNATGQEFAASSRLASNTLTARRNLDRFEELCQGLVALGMAEKEVVEVFRVVAAVALLAEPLAQNGGQKDGSQQSGIVATEAAATVGVAAVAELLGTSHDQLQAFLSTTESWVGGKERLKRARSGLETATLRSSVAQELYAALFSWLTRHVAQGIAPSSTNSGGRALGLLDLYGFEVFPSNGFEQFLINYCNERLQQFFNRQVFAAEANEYRSEGLDDDGKWCKLMISCDLPALALLEGGQDAADIGIFGVVNDRSRTALKGDLNDGASNRGQVAEAIASTCSKHSAFRRPARDADRRFGVVHFAGEVYYEAGQFVRKNASSHRPDIVEFLRTHCGDFVRKVMGQDAASAGSNESGGQPAGQKRRKIFGRTLISIFREELQELCTTLEARQCRHVRCLRPNDEQAVLVFDDESMLRQCRYSGLLEATRIRRSGYAHRRSHSAFAARYAVLLAQAEAQLCTKATDTADACRTLCQWVAELNGLDHEDLRVGRTKVFLRESAFAWLEAARERRAAEKVCASMMSSSLRRAFLRLRQAALVIQTCARRRLACRYAARLRADRVPVEKLEAAVKIQSCWRGQVTRRWVADQLGVWQAAQEADRSPCGGLSPICTATPVRQIQFQPQGLHSLSYSIPPQSQSMTSTPVRARAFDPLVRTNVLGNANLQQLPAEAVSRIYRNEAMRVLSLCQRVGNDIPPAYRDVPSQLQEALQRLEEGPSTDTIAQVGSLVHTLQAVLRSGSLEQSWRTLPSASPRRPRGASPDGRPYMMTAAPITTPKRGTQNSVMASPGIAMGQVDPRSQPTVKRSFSAHSLLRSQPSLTSATAPPGGASVPRPPLPTGVFTPLPLPPRPVALPQSMIAPPGTYPVGSVIQARCCEDSMLRGCSPSPTVLPATRLWKNLPPPRMGGPIPVPTLRQLPTPCRVRRGAPQPAGVGPNYIPPQLVRRTVHIVSAARPPRGVPPVAATATAQPVVQRQHTAVTSSLSPRVATVGGSRGCSPARQAPATPIKAG